MTKSEVDTLNRFMIAGTGHGDSSIRIMHPPTRADVLSKTDALVFAAWIVAMVDGSKDFADFHKILDRIMDD